MAELRLKEKIKESGMTQEQFANKLGISRISFVQALARKKFSLEKLEMFAEILGCKVTDLIDDGERPAQLVCPHCGKPIAINITKSDTLTENNRENATCVK